MLQQPSLEGEKHQLHTELRGQPPSALFPVDLAKLVHPVAHSHGVLTT